MYKIVVLGSDWDVYQYAFQDFINNDKILYIPTFRPLGIMGAIQRIHFNPYINRIINIPGKSHWNSYITKNITPEDEICFIVLENWLRLESGIQILPYIKKHFPRSKTTCFLQDLLTRVVDLYTNKPVSISYLKKHVDLCITYDEGEAQKYQIHHFHTVFSKIRIPRNEVKYDLYFLGRDKGRLNTLLNLAKEANKRRITCNFNLLEVPEAARVYHEGINYLTKQMPYSENLKNISESRCIIELLQPNAKSPTFRTWETLVLNKHLMTCNTQVQELPIYDKSYISIFTDADDFDWNFVDEARTKETDLDSYIGLINPERLLDYIALHLNLEIDY